MTYSWNPCEAAVNADETLDWLTPEGMAILQKRNGFRFGTDALALARFTLAHLRRGNGRKPVASLTDLGTGTGILPLLIARDTQIAHLTGIEIQPHVAQMASRSVRGNGLEHRVTILQGDLCGAVGTLGRGTQDLVVSNPPYQPLGAAIRSRLHTIDAARHEVHCTLTDVVTQAAGLLRPAGAFCVIHKPERLTELFVLLTSAGLEPKQLQFLHARPGGAPSLMLVRALRGGRRGLHVLPPLYEQVTSMEGTADGHTD